MRLDETQQIEKRLASLLPKSMVEVRIPGIHCASTPILASGNRRVSIVPV
jgi:hypothetical protein